MPTLRASLLTPTSPETAHYEPDGVVVVADGRIAEVGPFDGRPVDEDWSGLTLVPGFVDAHVHFPQTRIVGSASGPLLDWLARSTFPEEARFADRAFAEQIAEVFCARLAGAGTTLAMVYGPVFPEASDALFAAAERWGLRLIAGPVLMDRDCPDALKLPADRAIPALERLVETWHGRDGRLEVAVIPRFALSTSMALMAAGGRLADRYGLWVTTHVSENVEECRVARAMYGTEDYLAVYEDAGLVHAKSVYAHCVHFSTREWDRFAAAGAVVAHCPDSNFFLGSGRMPIGEVLARGVPLALGTDIAAGRSFRVPRIASSAYDNALATGESLAPARLFWWATAGGAAALGHPEIGRLAVGQEADLCALRLPEWVADAEGALSSALFDADTPPPVATWVRGRRLRRPPPG